LQLIRNCDKSSNTLSLPAPTLAVELSLQRYPAGCFPDGEHPVCFSPFSARRLRH